MVPQFSAQLLALDRKSIKMHGFIIPLEAKALQTHFLLASQSSDCKFCLEGGPKTYVEVIAKEGVRASWEPVTISGKLELLRNDPSGVFYRLIDAKALRADGRSKSGT